MALPNVGEHHPVIEDLNRTKGWKKAELTLPDCLNRNVHLLPLLLLVLRAWDLDWIPHHQLPALRPLNYTTGFPRSPACRQQTVGLLSLHNHMSQNLIINLFVSLCVCAQSPTGSFFYWRTLIHLFLVVLWRTLNILNCICHRILKM